MSIFNFIETFIEVLRTNLTPHSIDFYFQKQNRFVIVGAYMNQREKKKKKVQLFGPHGSKREKVANHLFEVFGAPVHPGTPKTPAGDQSPTKSSY